MKNNSIIIILGLYLLVMMLPVMGSIAQGDINGIYKTEEDFKLNVLTGSVLTDQDNLIKQQLGKNLLVYRKGEVKKYKFGSVYGYYQDSVKYRAWQKRKFFSDYGFYKVLDSSGLTIYAKRSSHHRSNGYTWYYYSLSPTGEIKRLTENNVQKDFSAYPEFVKAVAEIVSRRQENVKSESGESLLNTHYRIAVGNNRTK